VTDLWAIESQDARGEWLACSSALLFRSEEAALREMRWLLTVRDRTYRLVHYIAATEDT